MRQHKTDERRRKAFHFDGIEQHALILSFNQHTAQIQPNLRKRKRRDTDSDIEMIVRYLGAENQAGRIERKEYACNQQNQRGNVIMRKLT